jgi:hypothetical protein
MPAEIWGLTIHQPWSWAIAEGHKPIENRTWAPPLKVLRGNTFLAIHAGAQLDGDGIIFLRDEIGLELPKTFTMRAIVAIAKLDGVVTESVSPYFFGPYGWRLKDVIKLADPIPCRGLQKLWRPPPDVQAIARDRYLKAIAQ